jgi:predicted  nucleic acid-binding Zn-ribbon protein
MSIKIIANDIELHGEKVARILDIRPTLRDELELLLSRVPELEKKFNALEKSLNEARDEITLKEVESSEKYREGFDDGQANR